VKICLKSKTFTSVSQTHLQLKIYLYIYLFIYQQTANDARSRPEEGIGNAMFKKIGRTYTRLKNNANGKHGGW